MHDRTEKVPTPDYERPPVVETILGVQFDRLTNFKNAHLGGFWKTLDNAEWPVVLDASLLPTQFERFTDSAKWANSGQFMLTQDPSCRLQIKSNSGDRMIQIQNGRLHFNWLKQTGGVYPRYESVRENFVGTYKRFTDFVNREEVGDFRPNQWEVTYLNHIAKGTVWNTSNDWGFFRPVSAVPTVEGLVQGESFSGGWKFVIPEQRGRLHIQWQHARTSDPEEQEMIVLTFTARGPLEDANGNIQAVLDGLDVGRETIVRSFKEFMTSTANEHWGLKNGNG